ncbi:hypothetical protein [Reyranella sp.]|jgi:hypothetical protein|uniref:hypothetical protein n=1 Tax=Reyranella sp. TaxID=1929291 RepID=UPI000BDC0824|nr:hypothetical protein [Reyranella sp.]OYY37166.1 MAG: hypothetical protein B7Y57_23215 [Rhodospirillales bacterium 35-66-84]OYZ94137.1 MAG: hypothetical protein B7Y08_13450 [Rhodospirillales bacterium 24-66-33]OZB22978.1 MAG: hypothetical protein B7X63_20600 [Rhodospirillales bacterium 39-66-50]HQS17152.1 hypothetical protein [Reyranella sp.]HQT13777.1 hypothetical protein [Reyranella sp.]
MHIDLEVDHDRRLVIARAQGALQLPDITGYFTRLVFEKPPPATPRSSTDAWPGSTSPTTLSGS